MHRPSAGEYNPYFDRYISLVPEGDFQNMLAQNTKDTVHFFSNIPSEKHEYSYAPGKWTIKDVLMHIADTERVMSYRAFVASRADNMVVLPTMDENHYAANANVQGRSMDSLIDEFVSVRASTLTVFAHLTEAQSTFRARGETHPFTARALGYIMIGHILHHFKVTNERYL